jgi:hypothetical protein
LQNHQHPKKTRGIAFAASSKQKAEKGTAAFFRLELSATEELLRQTRH